MFPDVENGARRDASDHHSEDTDAVPTETTTLLNSDTSSETLSHAPSSKRRDSGADSGDPKHSVGTPRAVAIILSLWTLIFLQASNMSGVTIVQGAIAEDLESYEDAMWFTTSYLIATSALSPLSGRLATIFSPRTLVLPIGLFFAAGGLVTSLARSFAVFILGRVLTGVGAAAVMTLSVVLVLELVSKKRRGIFVGLLNCGFTIGLATGAVVYGALLPAIGWRPIFGVQSPVALVASLGLYFSVPRTLSPKQPKNDDGSFQSSLKEKLARIDYLGASIMVLTIVLFLYGLSGDVRWTPIILSVFSLFVFILIEVFVAADPIIPLSILSSRGILFSCIAQLIFMASRWTLLYYTPIFVLAVRNYAPAIAGSILIPTNLGFGVGGLIVGWLHVRRNGDFWLPSIIGLGLSGVTLYALSLVGTTTAPAWSFVLVVFLSGLATGGSLNYTLAHLLHLTSPTEHFISTSLLNTFRGFGGSFGTAIGGGIFYRLLRSGLINEFLQLDGDRLTEDRRQLITRLIGSPALVYNGGLEDAERQIAVECYAAASRGTWQAAAALTIAAVALQAATGWASPQVQVHPEDGETETRRAFLEREDIGER
ncbi:MFS general substrate transporter [Sodiomyces alkalinus F11]|uniref:MFS general substrate transporter n=1 Tax=Sodiomyces alkalinus (strain CBS 110278 / VKM F-3762 / F11) TaxID=1314773 RepID=A0A3N2Q3Z4_SODAK|nr:MFS general substrate transporter [Sodiomyces alkalinus F11]ROT41436.1 MFS general substrate transporter [Sodiomyces alkalinus F11]